MIITLCSTQPAYLHSLLNYHTPHPHVIYALRTLTCCPFLVFAVPLPPVVLVLQPPLCGTHSHLAFATLTLLVLSVTFQQEGDGKSLADIVYSKDSFPYLLTCCYRYTLIWLSSVVCRQTVLLSVSLECWIHRVSRWLMRYKTAVRLAFVSSS